jgi:beta-glucosidase
VDGKTTYSEGVNVGYRWFDKQNLEPLFPFGFGLSYTTFEYSGLKTAKAADGGVDVTVRIRNTGGVDADEVPQVYLGAPRTIPEGVQFPVRGLAAFDRVHVPTGQTTAVTMHVPIRQLQYWSTKEQNWVTATGERTLSVGSSSRTLPLREEIDGTKL